MSNKPRKLYRKLRPTDADFIITQLEKLQPISTISRRLGCDRRTLTKFIRSDETLRLAYRDAIDSMGDLAESKLFQRINAGDLAAIEFYLVRRCPDKYGDRAPVTTGEREQRIIIIGGSQPMQNEEKQ